MRFLTVVILAAVAVPMEHVVQDLGVPTTWLVARPLHGSSSYTEEEVRRVVSNPAILSQIDRWFQETDPRPAHFDSATALRWLAESAQPEYVPLFLHLIETAGRGVREVAIYGLLKQASREDVADVLVRVAHHEEEDALNIALWAGWSGGPGMEQLLEKILSQKTLSPTAVLEIRRSLDRVRSHPGSRQPQPF